MIDTPDSDSQTRENKLIARIRQGESNALRELYLRYFDRLYSMVFHQVGKNKQVAEDLTQETFVEMLKSIDKFRGRSKFYTWLCSIAYHRIADYYRRQERQEKYGIKQLDIQSLENNYTLSSEPDNPEIAEFKYASSTVEEALFRLPLGYRQVLIFKYVEEMSVEEICQITQRSTKSIEGLLTRGREALRKILNEQGNGLSKKDKK